ncbi:MAG: hypothetical protein ACLRRG_09615 [Barnesiella sp.]
MSIFCPITGITFPAII